ncbi:hypothetical protein AVEN_177903-1 [Araneus ventricosus]|uniref:Uncharacterized protein n=1 Tax=Araneus ventricosus TaxID=182803 RepID=A0A4Y2KES7_ARAVE|nr:hypothetical protein AVEN_177903-1 [Araneus ventricosus]
MAKSDARLHPSIYHVHMHMIDSNSFLFDVFSPKSDRNLQFWCKNGILYPPCSLGSGDMVWASEADDSLTRNKILTDDEIIRTVTAKDDDDDDVTPVNSIKISNSEAGAALNTSLQWAEEQNFEAHGNYAPQTFKRPRI